MNSPSNLTITDSPINNKKSNLKKNYKEIVEKKFLEESFISKSSKEALKIGDIIKIGYSIPEGNKERTQYYEGLIIAINNCGLSKTLTIRRSLQGIGIEQIFLLHSPRIVSIIKKQSSKIRRAKLYFLRYLKGNATRLKKIL
jgi:large subunit ribosomal protein L19